MTFTEYQRHARLTAQYPGGYLYPLLGLSGETGEIVEKFKKLFRSKNSFNLDINNDHNYNNFRIEIIKELGDVLWYISALATELEIDLDCVAETNIMKLQDRKNRDVIVSEGDDR